MKVRELKCGQKFKLVGTRKFHKVEYVVDLNNVASAPAEHKGLYIVGVTNPCRQILLDPETEVITVTELKIDRSTLPEDGQRVKFNTAIKEKLIGTFMAGDDLFLISPSNWVDAWDVYSWEPYEKPDKNKTTSYYVAEN